jgi:hypothetical protein
VSTGLSDAARAIEELTLTAWPPLETLLFDGWSTGATHVISAD